MIKHAMTFGAGCKGRRRRAITLAELLIAATIAVVIGLATVSMLSAAAYGSTSRLGMRKIQMVAKTISMRINHAIRTSVEVVEVDAGGEYVILWIADTNDDGAKQHGEMQLIEHNTTADDIRSYTDDSDTTDFSDAATFRTAALAGFSAAIWAEDITSADIEETAPGGTEAHLISYRFTIERDGISDSVIGAVAVRNTTPTP